MCYYRPLVQTGIYKKERTKKIIKIDAMRQRTFTGIHAVVGLER